MRHSENEYDHKILTAIASGQRITQRSLSKDLGVALGLTNLLIRRLVAKGYVRIAGMGSRQVLYLMTTAGWRALGRTTRQSLENTVHLYTQTREQIRSSLSAVSTFCDTDDRGQKRVVFYGAGDVAEIAFISLQSTDLMLVGVVDDRRRGRFLGFTICSPERLVPGALDSLCYGHVVVTSVRHAHTIRARLEQIGIPLRRISCIAPEVEWPMIRK